jgi:hypothetical protein
MIELAKALKDLVDGQAKFPEWTIFLSPQKKVAYNAPKCIIYTYFWDDNGSFKET